MNKPFLLTALMLWPGVCTVTYALISGWEPDLKSLVLKFVLFVYVVAAPAIFLVARSAYKGKPDEHSRH